LRKLISVNLKELNQIKERFRFTIEVGLEKEIEIEAKRPISR
jgi:hypothetical protein